MEQKPLRRLPSRVLASRSFGVCFGVCVTSVVGSGGVSGGSAAAASSGDDPAGGRVRRRGEMAEDDGWRQLGRWGRARPVSGDEDKENRPLRRSTRIK